MTAGERIKELRLQNKLTQKQLAEQSGLSEITIRKYETDERTPKFTTIEKICKVLHVNAAWLMGYDVPMDSQASLDQAWDAETEHAMDEIEEWRIKEKAFLHQLSVLGWTCERVEGDLPPEDPNYDPYYIFKKKETSFRVSWDDYDSFIKDSGAYFNKRLEKLYEKTKLILFSNPNKETRKPGETIAKESDHLKPEAAHERTDIPEEERTEEKSKQEDNIMKDENF